MSRSQSRRLSKIEDTIYGARKSIEDLTDAELERAIGVLLSKGRGHEISPDDAAFYASLKPVLAGSRGKYATMSDEELNARIKGLVGEPIATET